MGNILTRARNNLLCTIWTGVNVTALLGTLAWLNWPHKMKGSDARSFNTSMLAICGISCVASLAKGWVGVHGRESLILANLCVMLQTYLARLYLRLPQESYALLSVSSAAYILISLVYTQAERHSLH